MSDKSNQQISNLMDGELEANASQFLLKRMAADKALSQTWDKYHLIKSCLQKEADEPLVIDIASRVSAELGLIKENVVIEKPQVNRWLKPVMGLGIAASVAFMSVFMLQTQQIEGVNANSGVVIANKIEIAQPLKTNIPVTLASSSKSIVPLSLSRFPSVSAKEYETFNQGLSQNYNTPYLILINQSAQNKPLSPMKIKAIGD